MVTNSTVTDIKISSIYPRICPFANKTPTMKKAEMSQQETPTDTIGVIYCPRPGGHRRWKKILRLLKNSGICFDYIQSENSSDVERIATIMVRNGYTTIIIVGGDSALNYAINAIMQTEVPYGKRPVLGVIPAGYGNDFARYWNFEPKDYHLTIKRLKSKRPDPTNWATVVIT